MLLMIYIGMVMKMRYANVKNNKICAFCKYWYDPANSAIGPREPRAYQWEYDETVTSHCSQGIYTKKRKASQGCSYYECKV